MMSKRMVILFSILALVVIGAIYKMNMKPKSQLDKFTLSVNTWVGFGPLWLAQEQGYFKDEGVDFTLTTVEDVAQRKAAMINGSIDGLGDTVDLLVLERDQRVPAVAVMQFDESKGADGILVTDAIKSVKDLKGKTIAVQKNFVSESFLDYVLEQNGMVPDDVIKLDTEAGAAGAAFVSGNVDVAVTFEPWMSKAKERRGGKVLLSSADVPGVLVDILSVNEQYLSKHPDVTKKVMRAWFKAIDFWQANPDAANAIMAPHYNISTAEFADFVTGVKWVTYDENKAYFNAAANSGIHSIADTFSNLFVKTGQIGTKPDLSRAIKADLLTSLYE